MSLEFIHTFIPGAIADAPVLLLLHGTGGDEHSLLDLGAELLPGAHLLSPRGKVDENGMPRYFRRLSEGVFDLEDLRLRTSELVEFTKGARVEYNLADNLIYAVGYSNGANIAANILLTNTDALQGAVLFRAMFPNRPKKLIKHDKTPVLILSGERDTMIAPQSAEELAELLVESGAEVEHVWQPTGHGLTHEDVEIAKGWLSKMIDKTR